MWLCHFPEVPVPLVDVAYWGKTGRHLLAMSSSQFDPTRTSANRHSITSSARASTVSGIVRPSAFAVLRLDHQLVFGRRPHRKVGRLVAIEDSVDVAARERIGTPINFHVFISRLV
jgi:hypothetical protein